MASPPESIHAAYDVIIVGAGISGLSCAKALKEKYPKLQIAVAERYKGIGGRTYSYSPPKFPGVRWEMGAGRIRKDHTMLMNLLKEYKLTFVPIGSDLSWKAGPESALTQNPFEEAIIPVVIEPLRKLSSDTLAQHTLESLLKKTIGPAATKAALDPFPYRAEVNTLRADLALKNFLGGGEMASHQGYGVIAEGFSELIHRMVEDLQNKGVTFLVRHRLQQIQKGMNGTECLFEFGYKDHGPYGALPIVAKKALVLALHTDALREIRGVQLPMLKHLKSRPLLRTYMIFPTPAWFKGIGRVVTSTRLRYMIPINEEKGVTMISYTDAEDTQEYADVYHKKGEEALSQMILRDARALFPEHSIPEPLFFRAHLWDTGATYWLPGNYDPKELSKQAIRPHLNDPIFVCGESFSLKQAWVEGALEHTEHCVQAIKESHLLE